MNKIQQIAATFAAGAVALSPLAALAEDSSNDNSSAGVRGSFEMNIKNRLFGSDDEKGMNMRASSSIEDRMGDREEKRAEQVAARGQQAVDVRISMLEKFQSRIDDMKRLSSDDKASLSAELSAQIAALTALRAQIDAGVSSSTLIASIKSLRPDYRTFVLALPKAAITAGADRVMNVAAQMESFGAKLNTRISEAKAAGADVSVAESAYADYTAKIADAKVQAKAASDLVVNLKADNGDQTVLDANTAALKSARAKLEVARQDLKTARKDMTTIMQTVKGKGTITASSTVKVQ